MAISLTGLVESFLLSRAIIYCDDGSRGSGAFDFDFRFCHGSDPCSRRCNDTIAEASGIASSASVCLDISFKGSSSMFLGARRPRSE